MSAVFSECGNFRYRLGRRWDWCAETLVYIMLNPSTADAEQDDPTIRRCIGFAKAHGFGGIEVLNLYAYRATKPSDLKKAGYLVGPDNDRHIALVAGLAKTICVAWGANAEGLVRPHVVLIMLRALGIEPMCLSITKSGHPSHPLMLPSSCRLMPFTKEAIDEAMRKP